MILQGLSRRDAAPTELRVPVLQCYNGVMVNESKPGWLVYMVQCSDRSLYTGITTDIERRLQRHNEGVGARYTRSRLPVKLVYQETAADRSGALRREAQIKRLPAAGKRALLAE